MTFRKTKLIDNRPSWHPLRLCYKFGSQGNQMVLRTCFSPQIRWGGSFDLVLARRIVWAVDKSDRVYSSCGRKMKTRHQLNSFVSSALFSSENEKSESAWFKRCFPMLVSLLDWIPLGRKIQKHVLDSVAV